jgi:hypothetical protein
VEVSAFLVAGLQPFELVEPGKGPLDAVGALQLPADISSLRQESSEAGPRPSAGPVLKSEPVGPAR